MYVYAHIYVPKYVNTACSVCLVFLTRVCSELVICYQITSGGGGLFPREDFLLLSAFLSCP